MRITEAYTELRLTGAEVRLKNRSFKYDAVISTDDKGLPALSFYDLRTGETVAPESVAYEQVSAMLQSEDWELIPAVPAVSAQP